MTVSSRPAAVAQARSVDANLLLPLHALLEERNITHAGERLIISQPAMSGALARLRRHFDDELLVRSGRTYALTPLADTLRPIVAAAVEAAERAFGGGPRFAPDSAHRVFALSLSEYAMTVLTAPLVRLLSTRAPNVSVDLTPIPTQADGLALHLVRRDLIIGPAGFGIPGRRQPVFTDEFVCVVDRDNPRLRDGALELADLAALPYAVGRFGPQGSIASPDGATLAAAGITRDVQVVTPGLLTLPLAVAGSERCAFVPRRLARRFLDISKLTIARTPLPRIELVETAHWHPARADDIALSWFRGQLHEVAVLLEDDVDPSDSAIPGIAT